MSSHPAYQASLARVEDLRREARRRRPLHGDVLIADVEGEPHAAIEIATGATIADPFEPTAHLVDLLGVRAERLADGPRVRFGLGVLSRWAHRTA
jgi:hypothetical protein